MVRGLRSKGLGVVALVLVGLVLSACGSKNGPQAQGGTGSGGGTKTYLMGVAMPQTGSQSSIGLDFMRYMEMGVDDANKKYAADGFQIKMVTEDTQATAEIGITALNKLATVQKAPVVFTAWSSVVKAMGPVAQDLKTLVVNNGANSPELAQAGEYVINQFPLASVDIAKLADYTYKQMGKRKAAIVYLDNATGIGAAELYKQVFQKLGGTVVAMESIRADAVDASTQVAKVKAANPDVVHVHALAEAAVVLKAAREMGLSVPITSYSGVGEQVPIRKAAGIAINGLIYTSLSPDVKPQVTAFLDDFKKRYGHDPSGVSYSIYMHDSPIMYGEAIKYLRAKNQEVNGDNLRKAILEIKKFDLPFVGPIEFRADGTITLPVKLKQIKDFSVAPSQDESVTVLN